MSTDTEDTTPVGDAAAAVEDVNVTEKPEGDEPEDAASDPAQPKEPKKVDYRQKKIAELSYQSRDQRRQIDQLLGMVEKTISQPRQEEGPKPPTLEEFQTLESFLEARDEYRDKVRAEKDKSSRTEKQPDPRYLQAVQVARDDLMTAGSEKYDDFEELVTSDSLKITPIMRDAIFSMEDQEAQTEVTYFLGKNLKESLRISKLSPERQIAEMGKLEYKITSKPTPIKRPSNLPGPIDPVKGAQTNSNKLNPKDSMSEHIKKRRAGHKFDG